MCMDILVEMGKFCGYEILTYEKFCWICDVDSWKICVVIILAMFICACTCENFYRYGKIWQLYRYVKIFYCGELFGGALIILWWWDISCENIYIFLENMGFGCVGFGYGN